MNYYNIPLKHANSDKVFLKLKINIRKNFIHIFHNYPIKFDAI